MAAARAAVSLILEGNRGFPPTPEKIPRRQKRFFATDCPAESYEPKFILRVARIVILLLIYYLIAFVNPCRSRTYAAAYGVARLTYWDIGGYGGKCQVIAYIIEGRVFSMRIYRVSCGHGVEESVPSLRSYPACIGLPKDRDTANADRVINIFLLLAGE